MNDDTHDTLNLILNIKALNRPMRVTQDLSTKAFIDGEKNIGFKPYQIRHKKVSFDKV